MSAVRRIEGLAALEALVGQSLGQSDWIAVTSETIEGFADVTGDRQWIHVDRERAARESPHGTTIAHGFLTLSLIPVMKAQAYEVTAVTTRLNYGLGKVRFPAAVPAGARLRGHFLLKDCVPRDPAGARLVTAEAKIEIEGEDRPACIAETLVLYIP